MEPLILIVAAGEGTRLYPLTLHTPKAFVDIGSEKLIDKVVKALPKETKRAVLLRKAKKFEGLEIHLRDAYGFDNTNILYQDRLTSSPKFPLRLSLVPLAYLLGHLPASLSRNSRYLRQFDPVVVVPVDIICRGLDYSDLLESHREQQADITMPVQRGFVEGSNTRVYTLEGERFISATPYVHPPFGNELAQNQILYTHEGAYVFGRRFFDLPIGKLLRKDHRSPPFEGAYRSLKFVPYESHFEWIDVRDAANLKAARERFG
ncbi:NTP transferase domain-containing protein [Candidatus Woesearchaeota archaeon]|nr:NTP transferase domain-containing protein [Candidatus Woesearchaeota archaeon]